MYKNCWNVEDAQWALRKKLGGYHFYMSHFPTITSNLEKESLRQCTLNLFGHTHSKNKFFEDKLYMYNVAVDAHNNFPVSIEQVNEEIKMEIGKCISYLG